jgi:hypothetical protein
MTVHGYARVSAEQTFDNRPIVRPTSTLLKHVRGYYAGDQPPNPWLPRVTLRINLRFF